MPHLIAAVYVQNPVMREELILLPGDEPAPQIAALISNPAAWDVAPERVEAEVTTVEEVDVTVSQAVIDQAASGQTSGGGTAKKSPQRRARPSTQ
jgi:hypothetical protein